MKKRIAIHSAPRSGSTWVGSIFDSHPNVVYKYQPLFSYALKNFLDEDATKDKILEFFDKLEHIEDDFMDQEGAKERGIVPRFSKKEITAVVYKEVRYHHILENLLAKDPEILVIGIVRNPLAVIHSWLNAPKEFKKELGWKAEEEWRKAPKKNQNKPEEFNGFDKWKEITFLFERLEDKYPHRFCLVKYEDLLKHTEKTVRDLFDFVNLPMTDQTHEFLDKSCSTVGKDAYGVYRKKTKDDKWKSGLSKDIIKAIQKDLNETELGKYLNEQ